VVATAGLAVVATVGLEDRGLVAPIRAADTPASDREERRADHGRGGAVAHRVGRDVPAGEDIRLVGAGIRRHGLAILAGVAGTARGSGSRADRAW
jgi:hypothetical protein